VCWLLAVGVAGCTPPAVQDNRQYRQPPADASTSTLMQVSFREGSERLSGAEVSPDFFPASQAQPMLGRLFSADDYTPGATATVLLHHDLWRRVFKSDPGIIGSVITVDGRPATVVGIMPRDFNFPTGAQVWRPRK
jgi:putative ABC transport system permease protein